MDEDTRDDATENERMPVGTVEVPDEGASIDQDLVEPTSARSAKPVASTGEGRRWPHKIDVAVVVGLAVVALILRWGGWPQDGLWFDDSWVAAGAIHGKLTTIMTTGSGHPGFTLLLMALDRAGVQVEGMGYPALVAGVAGPPVLYLVFRTFGYARSICVLLATTLAVSSVHILYSGRVKSYTIDTLLVLCLMFALPKLAKRTWSWRIAVGLGRRQPRRRLVQRLPAGRDGLRCDHAVPASVG